MSDHNHLDEVALYGDCITCRRLVLRIPATLDYLPDDDFAERLAAEMNRPLDDTR